MTDFTLNNLSDYHVIYRCACHVIWTPKYLFRVFEGLIKELLPQGIPILLEWKSCEMIEINIQKDHVHLIVSVPLTQPEQYFDLPGKNWQGHTSF